MVVIGGGQEIIELVNDEGDDCHSQMGAMLGELLCSGEPRQIEVVGKSFWADWHLQVKLAPCAP